MRIEIASIFSKIHNSPLAIKPAILYRGKIVQSIATKIKTVRIGIKMSPLKDENGTYHPLEAFKGKRTFMNIIVERSFRFRLVANFVAFKANGAKMDNKKPI